MLRICQGQHTLCLSPPRCAASPLSHCLSPPHSTPLGAAAPAQEVEEDANEEDAEDVAEETALAGGSNKKASKAKKAVTKKVGRQGGVTHEGWGGGWCAATGDIRRLPPTE